MATATPTATPDTEVVERVQSRALHPYRVLIHDDPIHTYHEVAFAVYQTIPGKSYADGWEIATLVDTTGQGVAAVCPKEQAEHYREQFEV
jgi:ATP-dependent Clp protease adapter protein ClpS